MKKISYKNECNVVLLRFNDPPLNVLTFDMLNALTVAIDRANDDPAAIGIIIMGTTEHFSAGADINLFRARLSSEDSTGISRRFQETFDHVEQSGKPICTALAGEVMGSALELALAAHYRVCTPSTRFSMPEVNFGIIPGAGGTQRLPRTIGAGPALDMLLSGKPVDADMAITTGLVDALCSPSELVTAAHKFVMLGKKPQTSSMRTDRINDATVNSTAFEQAFKKASAVRPEILAPLKIIDAVKTGITVSYEEGLVREQTGFAECMASSASRNKIHLFFATRASANVPELDGAETHPITTTTVIGMGTMGTGIAQAFAAAGKKVLVMDVDQQTAQKGVARIAESLEGQIRRGVSSPSKSDAILGRLSIAKSWDDIASVDLVIESIVEDIALKQSLFAEIGNVCRSGAIVASNTSTINLDTLAEKLGRPERFIGLHFFNPAHSMPLVEVIRHGASDPAVTATAMKFMKELRKTPVLVNNSVGFIVNRLFIPYLIESLQLLEEGGRPMEIDAAMVEYGFPMGPLAVIDMAGVDTLFFTDRIMRAAYPFHIPLPRTAAAMVEQGLLGQKTGCGVYRYDKGDRTPKESGRTEAIISQVRAESGQPVHSFTRTEIVDRLVLRMVSEGFRLVGEGIAQRESDIDVAMVLGTGFPDFRGGVMKYARDRGLKEIAKRLAELAELCGERYQPCHYLLNSQ